MSFFLSGFRAALSLRLRRRRTWLLLLLPLAVLAAVRALPARETSAPVQVGVVLPEEGAGAFWELLESRGGQAVAFLPADEAQARRQVAAGRWDCALLLPEDFGARLARLDSYELVTVLTGPGSAAYPMVRETAAACLAQLMAPGLAERYLLDSGIADADSVAALRPRLERTLTEGERVLVSLETADGRPLDPLALAEQSADRLLAGLLAVVLLVCALFAAMDLGRWLRSPFARRTLPLRGAFALLLPRLAAQLLPMLCAGALALLPLEAPLRYLPALPLYLLCLGAAALALARCGPLCAALPALMPFVPPAALLLSPVLLDLSAFVPALAPLVRWNPVTLYLRACDGGWEAGLALLAGAAVLLALALLPELLPARRRS